MKRVQTGVLAGLSVLAAAGSVQASFLPVFGGTAPAGANTAFNYNLVFSTSGGAAPVERLETGDFLTIYDIPGFVSATAPAGFSLSTQNSGINGPGTAPADDAGLPNVTFTYTGAQITSNFGFVGSDNFTSRTHAFPAGTELGHIGITAVPAVPEPGALIFLSALPLALLRRR
jgi:hypothetical protein